MWSQVPTNKKVGGLWPNDGDGNAWSDTDDRLPTGAHGGRLHDRRSRPLRERHADRRLLRQISAFKKAGVEILTGVPIPPDFTTFWTQAVAAGLQAEGRLDRQGAALPVVGRGPRPTSATACPPRSGGARAIPFKSSLTGADREGAGRRLHDARRPSNGPSRSASSTPCSRSPTDALKRTTDIDDKAAIRDAIKATNLDTIVGPIAWTRQRPVRRTSPRRRSSVASGARARRSSTTWSIVSNKDHPEIPPAGRCSPIPTADAPAEDRDRDGDAARAGGRLARHSGESSSRTRSTIAVTAGETLGIVGPNGAGKTSLLNLISGNLTPDGGRIRLDGRDVTNDPPHLRARLGVGRTYQVPRPFGGMTVFENVLLGASYAGRHRASALGPATRWPSPRSIGRASSIVPTAWPGRCRCSTASGWSSPAPSRREPRLLLLDEIAGGLTEHEVDELVATIQAARAEGVTIVWIEHVVPALMAVVDRLVAMVGGRILMDGDPAAVMADPAVQAVYLGAGGRRREPPRRRRRKQLLRRLPGALRRVASRSMKARPSPSSVPMAPASRRSSTRSPACCRPAAARSATTAGSIDRVPAHRRVAIGYLAGARGSAHLPQPDGRGEPPHRRLPRTPRRPGTLPRSASCFPILARAGRAQRGRPLGRRAAGPRHRSRADGEPAPPAARRGLARSRADRRQAALRRPCRRSPRTGTTILLVEQNVDQALAAADRVYCLLEGRISLDRAAGGADAAARSPAPTSDSD